MQHELMIKEQMIYFDYALSDGKTLAYAYDEQIGEELVKRYNAYPKLLETLEAIVARVNGEWDNPALVKQGLVSDYSGRDIIGYAQAALDLVSYS